MQMADWIERLFSKVRMLEYALERALDQLEGEPDGPSWRYVRDQVDKAHDWAIDAVAIAIAHASDIETLRRLKL